MERGGGRVETPGKPLEDSSMTHEVSEYISFWVSQLEGLVKGFSRKVDLDNLRTNLEKSMEGSVTTLDMDNLEIQMEENGINMEERMMEIISNLIQILEGKICKEYVVGQCSQEDK